MERSASTPPAVEMIGITRRFARALANDNVNLSVARGEVHAVVGENGAGKSTLMKILYGLYRPDGGEIRVNGQHMEFHSPAEAIRAGIGMVHQHFMLVPPFSVTENVVLGNEKSRGGFLRASEAVAEVRALSERYHLPVDPESTVADLGVGEQQRVEILKILYRKAEIIILDEPTAVLTPQEVDQFFDTVRNLRDLGKTIIIITHKLREVLALTSYLTILRGGRNVGVLKTSDTTAEEIARLMVGRDVVLPTLAREIDQMAGSPPTATVEAPAGISPEIGGHKKIEMIHPVLTTNKICLAPRGHSCGLSNITLTIAPGEILGIAGVEGNGQTELVEVLTGLQLPQSGSIQLDGIDITRQPPRDRFAAGLACIPEDRHRKGLVLDFNLRENLLLGRHYEARSGPGNLSRNSAAVLKDFDVRPANPRALASHLSGGNQQKLIVAREFTRGAKFLIAAQPTRGVDLGAIEFIHRKLLELRSEGTAILLISAELSEVMSLSDRIAVMYTGRITFETPNRGVTEHELGYYMAGGTQREGSAAAT